MSQFNPTPTNGETVTINGVTWKYSAASGTWDVQTTTDPVAQVAIDQATIATQQAQVAAGLRTEIETYATAAAFSARFYDTIELGRAGVQTDGLLFGVRAGQADGLTRASIYRRDSSTTHTFIYSPVSASEFDAIFPDGSTYEEDLCGWSVAVLDSGSRVYAGIDASGAEVSLLTTRQNRLIVDTEMSVGTTLSVGESITSPRLKAGSSGEIWELLDDDMSGWASVEIDAANRILSGITDTGLRVDYLPVDFQGPTNQSPAPSGQYTTSADLNSTFAVYSRVSGSDIDVYAENLTTGVATKLTNGGRNTRPRLTADGARVLYARESDGAIMHVPISGGVPYKAFADTTLGCWGDSMTSGFGSTGWGSTNANTYPSRLAGILGRQVINRGTNSLTALQIATRQGGVVALVTVSGNQIPASGPVNVTLDDGGKLSPFINITLVGTLAGVRGTLSRVTEGGQITFTRSANGNAVACSPGTAFVVDATGVGMYSGPYPQELDQSTTIIWAGRNGFSNFASTTSSIAAMVANLKNWRSRFLVLSITPGTNERNTSGAAKTDWDAIQALNASLSSTYGNRYVDLIAPLQAANNGSAQDLLDVAQGTVPLSLRSDVIHLNDIGYLIVAQTVASKLNFFGW